MAQNRQTLFIKLAIKNGLMDAASGERILATIAERREIGVEKSAHEIAIELGILQAPGADKIREAVDRALPPEQVAGFKIEQLVGRGAVGTVYRATQLSLDKAVAIKLLHPNHTEEERFVADFLHEAKAVAKLNHPNIVHAIDAGQADGRYYFAMEYVEGETLREKLSRRGKLSTNETIEIAKQITAGLAHAHQGGFLHRDLKPDNILIGKDGRTRIADLGLAIPVDDAELLAHEHKKQGTPFYLSPEAASSGDLDARSDLYSLGALLYQCLAGKPVFTGSTVKEILTKQVHQDPLSVAEAAGSSSPIDAVVMKLLAKDPAERYASAEEVSQAIETAAKEPAGRRAPGAAPRSRKRPSAGGGAKAASAAPKTPQPRAAVSPTQPTRVSNTAYRRPNKIGSYLGLGTGGLIALVMIVMGIQSSNRAAEAPSVDESHQAELDRKAELIIERRIAKWNEENDKAERLAREAAQRVAAAKSDSLKRRALLHLLREYPDLDATTMLITELEKVDSNARAALIAGPAKLLEQAKAEVAAGRLWAGYLILDDRPKEARKDEKMNQQIEEYLSDLDTQIDEKVAADLKTAQERLVRKDFKGAIAIARAIGNYADKKSAAKGEEFAKQVEADEAEYSAAETQRRLGEERRKYAPILSQFRSAANQRAFKDAISAAITLQAEMSTEEVRGRLETDLQAFAMLDAFNKDALAQLSDHGEAGKTVTIEMKPIGEAPRGRKYTCKIDRVSGNEVFVEVDRAVFPLAVDKITDQTIFDLVLERHGETNPRYLVPLGVLFMYRGNFDIASSHFDLARNAGTDPDTWVDHLEFLKGLQ